ncbi:MAG: hypothetical protein A4E35_01287 [Methanoregula sp. PtaU1.Bin051]|nr:MAG: hypothetical protein A4E35_01287 [Methanoregula sp. PtaU1.Bin051]
MTSRRCVVLEQGVREQLQRAGYTVQAVPPVFLKKLPPAHLIATRGALETRYIRIRKMSRTEPTVANVERFLGRDITRYRTCMERRRAMPGLHYEIWVSTLRHGLTCFEVYKDRVREIPRIPPATPAAVPAGGTS